jgi:hypothetical protein
VARLYPELDRQLRPEPGPPFLAAADPATGPATDPATDPATGPATDPAA